MNKRDGTNNQQYPDFREGKSDKKTYVRPSVESESLLALEAFGGCSLTSDNITCGPRAGGTPSSA